MLGDIDIEFALQIDPQFGTITEQLSKSQRHRWRDRLFSVGMSCSVCREMPNISSTASKRAAPPDPPVSSRVPSMSNNSSRAICRQVGHFCSGAAAPASALGASAGAEAGSGS